MNETPALECVDIHTGQSLSINSAAERRSWLIRGERVHRQLRPDLDKDYASQIERMTAEGARLAQLVEGNEVFAIALWRVFETTYCGRRLEIEDLVSDEERRSEGHGASLLRWLDGKAKSLGCRTITLISATHRRRAHRFYFREEYEITAFHFVRQIGG